LISETLHERGYSLAARPTKAKVIAVAGEIMVGRATGIEPASPADQAIVLPLNHARHTCDSVRHEQGASKA
jgi:hypothetical protein